MQEGQGAAKLIVVEDDARLRNHVVQSFSGEDGFVVLGAAATLEAGLALVDLDPDLALLDLDLPDGSGVRIIEAIRRRKPDCRILVYTIFEDRASVLNTLRAGADGYILKDTGGEQLLAHARATLAGETQISAIAASHLLSLVREDPRAPAATAARDTTAAALSPREQELLEYLARGLSRKEAARLMNLSPYTVAEYVQGIYRKLQVKTRGEAVYEAIQSRLIRIDQD